MAEYQFTRGFPNPDRIDRSFEHPEPGNQGIPLLLTDRVDVGSQESMDLVSELVVFRSTEGPRRPEVDDVRITRPVTIPGAARQTGWASITTPAPDGMFWVRPRRHWPKEIS